MRENQLFANLDKRIFGVEEIPVLGCFIGKHGVRADPEMIKSIVDWPRPASHKDLRKWLGLANYLHIYSANDAEMACPLSDQLKKNVKWAWSPECENAFSNLKQSLLVVPVLALPDDDKPFSAVCGASDFAISCALLQKDHDGHERVVSFQSQQLKVAEKNYTVNDKELLAMKFVLMEFHVHLLGPRRLSSTPTMHLCALRYSHRTSRNAWRGGSRPLPSTRLTWSTSRARTMCSLTRFRDARITC